MSQTWSEFISTLPLERKIIPLTTNAIYPIQCYSLLVVEGLDAIKFLQGQLSCDVTLIKENHSGLGSHSNAKGRMQSSFRIYQLRENAYLLRVHHSIAELAKAALAKYIIFSKATIQLNNEYAMLGLIGEQAKLHLQNLFSNIPTEDFAQHNENGQLLICTSHQYNSYELYTPIENACSVFEKLCNGLTLCSEQQHTLLENQLGLAFVENTTSDNFTPQAFNYPLTNAVSFKKGCYTGQEIVARLHYLGKMKKHMRHFLISSQHIIKVGDKVHLAGHEQSVGDILSAVQTNPNTWDTLININNDIAVSDSWLIEKNPTTSVEEINLPYALE